ncbi:MAG: Glyoxalase-like domain [Planctomycetota bacterium]|jgi:predicted enzyme related to lactoylglutathione lyase
MTAPICHIEIPAPDLAASERFYAAVFGWSLVPAPAGVPYRMLVGSGMSAALDANAPAGAAGCVVVMAVADIAATLALAVAHGATPAGPVFPLPHLNAQACYLLDPAGNRIGLFQSLAGG